MFCLETQKETEVWSRKLVWAPALTASQNGNLDALARPNDRMTSTASIALRQRWPFSFKDLELACTLKDFVYTFSATSVTLSTCQVRTQGMQARRAQVCEKNRVSALTEKCGSWTRARKASRPRRLRERLDVLRLLFTHVIAINQYYVIFECLRTLRYSDTPILRNFESFCKNYV